MSMDKNALHSADGQVIAAGNTTEDAEKVALRLAAIVNSSDDAIVSKTLDGIIQSWNRGAEMIFGYTAAEAVGQHITLIIPQDRLAEEEHVLASLRRGEKIDHFETVRRAKDGRLVEISLTVSPIIDSHGRIIGASKVARDITARKRASEALQESEERFRHMADHAPVMIWVSDRSGSSVYLNKLWYDITGQTQLEASGFGWLNALHPGDYALIRDTFLSGGEKRDVFRLEHRLRGKDGNYHWVVNAAAPRFGAHSEFLGYIGSIIEIDERKQAEETLKRAQEQSDQLNALLEARVAEKTGDLLRSLAERERLQGQLLQAQKMESIGTLASGVAHDFNNLLNIILAHASVIRSDYRNSTAVGENLAIIEETVARATGVVQQLMLVGRKSDDKFQPLALNAVVDKISKLVKEIFPRTIATTLDLDRSLGTILGNETQIHQIFLNLCLNARDAMPDGGQISIRTDTMTGERLRPHIPDAKADSYAVIRVTDTGSGMDEETRRRVFEPFFTTKGAGQGSGLGLAVVYGIVQSHRGFIEVASQRGQGTTFSIYLPTNSEQSSSSESSKR
jgi:PAS domain S-box-containing protein